MYGFAVAMASERDKKGEEMEGYRMPDAYEDEEGRYDRCHFFSTYFHPSIHPSFYACINIPPTCLPTASMSSTADLLCIAYRLGWTDPTLIRLVWSGLGLLYYLSLIHI